MTIHIRFFAIARDHAGVSEFTTNAAEGASVQDVLDKLVRDFPPLGKTATRLATAVNQEYVSRETVLRDGDELALIPPVSGG